MGTINKNKKGALGSYFKQTPLHNFLTNHLFIHKKYQRHNVILVYRPLHEHLFHLPLNQASIRILQTSQQRKFII